MKRLVCCLGLILCVAAAFSQRQYFIYLQAEPEQPFFVKANSKVFSSTASGYLILTRLEDSTHDMTVGFPQNKWPEQQFKIAIRSKDHGFLLKYFADKGWGLVDLQTSSVQMAVASADKVVQPEQEQPVSAFTDVLSRAANDPSLREKPVPVSAPQNPVAVQPVANPVSDAPPRQQTITPAVTVEPEVRKDEPVAAPLPVVQEVIVPADYKPSVITRKSESSTTDGFGLTFIDEYADGTRDTIRILIPNQRSFASIVKDEPKDDKKFLDVATDPSPAPTVIIDQPVAAPASRPAATAVVNRNYCADTATESDFRKLRRKMASQTSDDDMVAEALKSFRTRCFTVMQVKHLGALFLFDAGKYKLYDAAYTHVKDIENFGALQSELTDKYYINRFQAMLRN